MLRQKQEELIHKCIGLYKNSVQSNVAAQDAFLSEFSDLPQYKRMQGKIKEADDIQSKVRLAAFNNHFPSFTPREKVLFISILKTVEKQLESMSLIMPAGDVDADAVLYNQKISTVCKEIDELLKGFKQQKVL